MRVAIDARELSKQQPGGFYSYLVGLLSGLAEVDRENEYILLVESPMTDTHLQLPANTQFRIVRGNRIIADRMPVQRAIRRVRPDVVHFPCNYGLEVRGIPSVVTLHDCICLEKPAKKGHLKHRILTGYNARMTRKTIPNADRVITISNYSKSRILEYFDIEDRVRMIYQGVSRRSYGELSSKDAAELPLTEPYILALAAPDPRKNVAAVIQAFADTAARREGCKLVIVGNHASGVALAESEMEAVGVSRSAIILTGVTDAQLYALYGHAVAYTFASLEEGFGLTPLEAMSCGCPVLSSHASVMPEILGDSVLYFDPRNTRDLAAKIDQVWRGEDIRSILRTRGYKRVARYSWCKTASETLAVYEELAGRGEGVSMRREEAVL